MKFDPISMCRILNEECVEYVVLGGFAITILNEQAPDHIRVVNRN